MKILLLVMMGISMLFSYVAQVSALIGKADVLRNKKDIPLKLGMKLEQKDVVITKENAKVQLIFKDRTIITIGRNSKFSISEYLYDDTPKSKTNFSITKGLMKVLDGKIGKIAPKRFRVKTKNALIGIRGTMFVVEVKKDITKVGMLGGSVFFQPIGLKQTYVVKTGEFVIYNPKAPKKVVIKKGFIEPKSLEIKHKQEKKQVKSTTKKTNTSLKEEKESKSTIKKEEKIKESSANSEVKETTVVPTTKAEETNVNTIVETVAQTTEQIENVQNTATEDSTESTTEHTTTKIKETTYSDDYTKLGYWAEDNIPTDTWFEINDEITSSDDLNYLMIHSVKADYIGHTVAVTNGKVAKGTFNMNIDFSNQSFAGDFNFKTDNGSKWEFNVNGNVNSDSSISSSSIGATSDSEVDNISGTLNGNVYGKDGDGVAGSFDVRSGDIQAIGKFAGSKENPPSVPNNDASQPPLPPQL